MDGLQGHVADLEIATRIELVDVGSHIRGQLAPARNEIVVQVRVERMADLDVQPRGGLEVALDVAQRVDYETHAAVGIRDEEAAVPELVSWDRLDGVHGYPREIGAVVSSTQIVTAVTTIAPP